MFDSEEFRTFASQFGLGKEQLDKIIKSGREEINTIADEIAYRQLILEESPIPGAKKTQPTKIPDPGPPKQITEEYEKISEAKKKVIQLAKDSKWQDLKELINEAVTLKVLHLHSEDLDKVFKDVNLVEGDFELTGSDQDKQAAILEQITRKQNEAATKGKDNLEKLRPVYDIHMRFPKWVIDQYPYEELKNAIVYTTSSDEGLIKKLIHEREPVNIAMTRKYDQSEMEKKFGWSTSYYQRYYDDNSKLAPNLAIYTPVRVDIKEKDSKCADDYTPSLLDTTRHVINAIGLAFDNRDQPDYKYYFDSGMQEAARTNAIKSFYKQMFQLIYQCAKDLDVSEVAMSLVGANNFALLYTPGGADGLQENIWAPVFLEFLEENPEWVNKTVLLGTASAPAVELITNQHQNIKQIGNFPAAAINRPNTLFVNAWDCHSIPGNGNCGDNSLDGWVGRTTSVASVGWAGSNPFLNNNIRVIQN